MKNELCNKYILAISYFENMIQIIHVSEGISKNCPHKAPLEQSNTPEAVAEVYFYCFKGTECG